MKNAGLSFLAAWFVCCSAWTPLLANVRSKQPFNVIAYYSGGSSGVRSIDPAKLSHIIYCFSSLRGNRLHVSDTSTVKKLVALKKRLIRSTGLSAITSIRCRRGIQSRDRCQQSL